MGRGLRTISTLIPVVALAWAVAFATGQPPAPGQTGAASAAALDGATTGGAATPTQTSTQRRYPRGAEVEEEEEGVRTPVDPDAVTSDATPVEPATTRPKNSRATARRQPAPRAPGDLVITKNLDLGTGKGARKASLVAEPSVARNGSDIFAVWNWYAARSTDGGATVSFMNPEKKFPNAYGGFCCDQLATYVPSRDLWVWVMLYEPNAVGNNGIRIAVADSAELVTGNFSDHWMVSPQLMGFKAGHNIDQPDMAFSDNYLYIEAEVFKGARYKGISEIMRFDLDDLADGGGLNFDYRGVPEFSPGLTFGATDTMYIAGHTDNDTLKLYAWPESLPGPSLMPEWSIQHAAYPQVLPYQCPALFGSSKTNWCRRSDDRINTGWVHGGQIGFTWNASQGSGGLGLFPYPYIHAVQIDESGKTLSGEPVVWSSQHAWQYGSVSPNAVGDLGGVGMAGGGAYYPACATLVRDNYSGGAWAADYFFNSDVYPGRSVAGDYQSSYPNAGNAMTWSAGCSFALDADGNGKGDNTDVHPLFISFGREDDSPN